VSYLIDTNVISELRKGKRANPGVTSWFASLADEEIFLSALTLGEIRRGIESIRRRDPSAASVLESWFGRISEAHRDRVVAIDRAIAEEWGRMNAPDPLPVVDGMACRHREGGRPDSCDAQHRRHRPIRGQLLRSL
jgi:predicted nucleic acid-binding protein